MSHHIGIVKCERTAVICARVCTVAVICAAFALWLCASASATPSWLGAAGLSEAGQSAYDPQIAFDSAGDAVAVWERYNGSDQVIQAALKPASSASFQTAVNLSEAGQNAYVPQIAVDSEGDAVAVWERYNGSNEIIQAALKPASSASFQTAVDLSEAGQNAYDPQIAVDSAGDAVAVWTRYNGSDQVIQAALKPASSASFQPAVNLSEAGQNAGEPQIAFDSAGDAVAVWTRYNGSDQVIQAALKPASSASFQTAVNLSEAGQNAYVPQIAFDSAGDAVAVWERYNGSNEIIQAALKPASSTSFQTAVDLSEAGQNAYVPQIAVDSEGDAVAVWQRYNGSDQVIQAALKPASSASFQTAVDLSEAGQNAYVPQIAVDSEGDAVAVWERYNGSNEIIQAALKPASSASFQTAVDLSEAGQSAYEPQIAVDPEGDAVAVWTRSNGSNWVIQARGHEAGPHLSSVSIPSAGTVGQSLSFSASAFDIFSSIEETRWSFGDGGGATGSSATHVYASPGSYEVKVESENAFGNLASQQATISVTVPPAKQEEQPQARQGSSTAAAPSTAVAARPVMDLLTKAPQPLINTRALTLKVTCGALPCSAVADAWVRLPHARKALRLGRAAATIVAGALGRLSVAVPESVRHAVRAYLLRHRHYDVKVHVSVTLTPGGEAAQVLTAVLPIWTYPGFR